MSEFDSPASCGCTPPAGVSCVHEREGAGAWDAQIFVEHEFYLRTLLPTLLPEHEGRHVLVRDRALVGLYDTYDEALEVGYKTFGRRGFLCTKIAPVDLRAIEIYDRRDAANTELASWQAVLDRASRAAPRNAACGAASPTMSHLRALCEGLELPLELWLSQPPEALRIIGAAIADQAKSAR